MRVSLQPVNRANLSAVLELSVSEDQRAFVAPNVLSLAQAAVSPELCPRAIYTEDELVGFVLYGFDTEEDAYCIARLMIDQRYQSRGYGREALRLTVAEIRNAQPTRNVVCLSVEPENTNARNLYERFGFMPDGRIVEGEIVYRLSL